MNKKIVTAGLLAGLLVGGGAGAALALTGTDNTTSTVPSSVIAGADDLGTDPADESQDDADRSGFFLDTLQPLVDNGTLTQAQVDAVITALQAARPMGGGGHHGGRRHGGLYGIDGSPLAIVADTVGLSEADVVTAVQGGQTIADLAAANGSSADAVIAALVAEVEAHLAAEVEAGDHTQEEADARLARATTAITDFVNETPTFPMGGGHHEGDDNA